MTKTDKRKAKAAAQRAAQTFVQAPAGLAASRYAPQPVKSSKIAQRSNESQSSTEVSRAVSSGLAPPPGLATSRYATNSTENPEDKPASARVTKKHVNTAQALVVATSSCRPAPTSGLASSPYAHIPAKATPGSSVTEQLGPKEKKLIASIKPAPSPAPVVATTPAVPRGLSASRYAPKSASDQTPTATASAKYPATKQPDVKKHGATASVSNVVKPVEKALYLVKQADSTAGLSPSKSTTKSWAEIFDPDLMEQDEDFNASLWEGKTEVKSEDVKKEDNTR